MPAEHPEWVRWYPTKFISGVVGLNLEQVGAYTKIICSILDSGECDGDDAYLARLLGCDVRRARRVLSELVSFGKLDVSTTEVGRKYEQSRAEVEHKYAVHRLDVGPKKKHVSNENNGPNAVRATREPTRARSELELEQEVEEEAPPPKKKPTVKKKVPLPDDFEPDFSEAEKRGLNAGDEWHKFQTNHAEKRRKFIDWNRAWINWCIKGSEFRDRDAKSDAKANSKPRGTPNLDADGCGMGGPVYVHDEAKFRQLTGNND